MNSISDYISEHEISLILKKYIIHRNHVHEQKARELSMLMFDVLSLSSVFSAKPTDKCLLSASAVLHDIGYYINKKDHHLHSSYILMNEKSLDCLPTGMRTELALICGSHRKSDLPDLSALEKSRKKILLELVAILKLADALADKHIKKALFFMDGCKLNLIVAPTNTTGDFSTSKLYCKLDLKSELSKQLFGLTINIDSPDA